MSYQAAIDRLYALGAELHTAPGAVRRKFRLEDMHTLLAALGDPQLRFPAVLIAGTNGKGSTAATLASILKSAGYRTGLYTSPHLERANERIQVNGQPIGDEDFAAAFDQVERAAETLVSGGELPAAPSFFEAVTAMAFLHFAGANIDIAVLEVGLGGRLDATNVVEPLLSVVSDISLDHTEWLGTTIAAIAREKAGILRQNGVMVTLPQHPEANQALGEAAVALNVRGVNAASYLPHGTEFAGRNLYPINVIGHTITVDSPLRGHHQQRNIALAIAAAVELQAMSAGKSLISNGHSYLFRIEPEAIEDGIRRTVWPGRLESFPVPGRPRVLLDVAHNPAGAWALRSVLSTLLGDAAPPLTLIFGCLADKAVAEMAQILFPLFDQVVIVPVNSPRAASTADMLAAASATGSTTYVADNTEDALDVASRRTPPDGWIVAAGSVHLVGELRAVLTGLASLASGDPVPAHA